jgi:uncharacterized membrane protein YczE
VGRLTVRFRRVVGRPVGTRTLALVAAGGVLIGVGAAAMIEAGLGVTPWDVLTTAVSDRGGVTVGVAGAALSVAVYALCAPFGRLPGWGNLVLLVGVSGAVDGGLAVLGEPAGLAGQVLLYAAGVPVVCFGVALVVRADIGVGPLEMVMLVATDRSVPLVPARVVIEATTLTVGWSLGGALGVGTAGFALSAGPLIAGSLRLLGGPPAGGMRRSGAGGEELEAGDGQVAQHREAHGHHGAGHDDPPG